MKATYFKTILSVSLVLTSLVSVEGTEDTHLRYSHDDNGRASPPVVLADEGIQRRLQVPPSNDPRAFFYGRVWFDNNANSKMDDGEEGMPRVQVSLWRADLVAAIKSRTTDENGYFEFPLKSFRKRVARTYYLQLEMKDEKKERYVFFQGGDSKVDESGKSESVVIPKLTTTGGRYEIYAGVRAKTAVFYGTMWFDNNGNDMMDEAEERVLRNPLSLLRTENGEVDENVQEKRTGKNTGTYEISLDEYDLDTTYKYFPEFRLPPDYIFVTTGDSHVDRDGRGLQTSVARGRRYKVNAGIRRKPFTAVFYGKLWFDSNANGKIDKGEKGVNGGEVKLFRIPLIGKRRLVKRTPVREDGTYNILLKNIRPDNKYYLRFVPPEIGYMFVTKEDSKVDEDGGTAPISLQFENREQKLNAGIVLIPFLIFAARSEDNGSQPYTYTDKASPGISLLKRIGADSKPAEFTTVNGHVYFSADDGTNGRALWKTDLTEDGTELVPGSEHTDPSFLTAYKKDLYFIAKGGSELWVSGGTPEKATILKTFGDSSLKTLDSGFTAYDDSLYFTTVNAQFGTQLWKTDGTSGGTKMIKGMERGDTVSISAYPRDLTVYKGKLYFIHQPAKSRREIWVSDGSSDGTAKANYIYLTKNWPHGLMVLREKLYFFVKEDFPVVYALIEYDGARSGSTLVKNFPYEGYDESFAPGPLTLTVLHDKMFFTATVDGRYKLWVTDGTSDGTHVVKDNIYTGAVNPAPYYRGRVVEFGDRLFLPARDSPDLPQEKLWATDGSEAGTEMVPVGTPSTDFLSLEVCNGRLYFTILVDSQSQKIELWSTDATADGTERIDGPAILLPGNLDVSLHCYDQTL